MATETSKISESVHGGVKLFENDKFASYMSDALLSERGTLKAKTQEGVDTLVSVVLAKGWNSAFSRQNKLYKAYKTDSCAICAGCGSSTCFPCSGKGRVSCSTCSGSRMTRCRSCSGGYSRCGSCNGSGSIAQVEDIRDVYTGQYAGHRTVYYSCGSCMGQGTSLCYSCNGSSQVPCPACSDGTMLCKQCYGSGSITCTQCAGVGQVNRLGYIKESLSAPQLELVDASNDFLLNSVKSALLGECFFSNANAINHYESVVEEDGSFHVFFTLEYEVKSFFLSSKNNESSEKQYEVLTVGLNKKIIDIDGYVKSRIEESILIPDRMFAESNSIRGFFSFTYLQQLKSLINIGEAKTYMVFSTKKKTGKEKEGEQGSPEDFTVDWSETCKNVSFLIRKHLLIRFFLYQLMFLIIWYGLAHYRVYETVITSEFLFFTDNPIFFIKSFYATPIEQSIPMDGWILVFVSPVILVLVEYCILMFGNLVSFKYVLRNGWVYYGSAVLFSAILTALSGLIVQKSAENSIIYNGKFTWIIDKYADKEAKQSFVDFLEKNPYDCGPRIITTVNGKVPLYLLPLNSEKFYAVFKKTGEKYNVGMTLLPGLYEIEMGKTSKKTKVYRINLSPENYCMKVYL